MPTTRAMARQASVSSDNKENELELPLRKKPLRRAASTKSTAAAAAASKDPPPPAVVPLSPKKVGQLTHPGRTRNAVARNSSANAKPEAAAAAAAAASAASRRGGGVKKSRAAAAAAAAVEVQNHHHTQSAAGGTNEPAAQPSAAQLARDDTSDRPTWHGDRLDRCSSRTTPRPPTHQQQQQQQHGQLAPAHSSPTAPSPAQGFSGSGRRSLWGTPMQDKTLTLPPRPRHVTPEQISDIALAIQDDDDDDDESDDELCGPNTPRPGRNATAYKSPSPGKAPAGPATVKTVQTPQHSRKMLLLRPTDPRPPQTTKVPLKPADAPSPRRPMSVSRGSCVAYVFHPLPKANRARSPLNSPYRWPVSPSEEEEEEDDDDDGGDPDVAAHRASKSSSRKSSASSRENTPGPRRSLLPTPPARERLTQLFSSDFGQESDEDDDDDEEENDEEEEPIRSYFPAPGKTKLPAREIKAAADFVPDEESDESDESAEDLHQDLHEELLIDLADTSLDTSDREGSESCETSQDDTTRDEPRLPSGLFERSPSQTSPSLSRLDNGSSSPESADELGDIPTLTRLSHLSGSSVVGTPPQSRLSSVHRSQQTPSLLSSTTPTSSRPRLSHFHTPHMRSALEQFEHDTPPGVASVDTKSQKSDRRRTVCINPSLLSQEVHGGEEPPPSPRKDSLEADDLLFAASVESPAPCGGSTRVSAQPESQTAPFVTKHDPERAARLSLLLNTDGLVESPPCDDGRWREAHVGAEQSEADVDRSLIHHKTAHRVSFAAPPTYDLFDASHIEDDSTTTPNYARATVCSDVRRKSTQVLPPTPKPPTLDRVRTAAETTTTTTVKPTTTAASSFAKLRLDRQELPLSMRRRSMFPITPSAASKPQWGPPPPPPPQQQQQPPPSSLPRSTTGLALRKRNSIHSLSPAETATSPPPPLPLPLSSAPITPRPRCYTPTTALTALKAASTPLPASPPQPTPPPETRLYPVTSPGKAATNATATPARPTRSHSPAPTPHPTAPLRSVTAYVEVFTRASVPASASFVSSLRRLGARVVRSFSEDVTHVVWKDGNPATLTKVKAARRAGREVHVVGSRWVVECDGSGERVDERRDEFRVDVDEVLLLLLAMPLSSSAGPSRARKRGLEPKRVVSPAGLGSVRSALLLPPADVGSSRDRGRLSVGEEGWAESPIKGSAADVAGEAWSDDEDDEDGEAWFETPRRDTLAPVARGSEPVGRVRRLELLELEEGKGRRRLTAWEG